MPAKVDKYGRQVSKASKKAKSQLRAFYKVEDDQENGKDLESGEEDEGENEETEEEEEGEGEGEREGGEEEDEEDEEEEEEEEEGGGGLAGPEESRQAYLTRLSRGEVSGSSSDTSSDEDDEDDEDEDEDGLGSGEIMLEPLDVGVSRHLSASEEAVPVSEETSRRLAVTNCDWDHIRARDLMVLCGSFCPGSARLMSVEVFPSDFGLEMMEVEAAAGPHAAL
ncbi:unnamed protein product, partial [Hapterophycus canaliculatus]